MPGESSAREWIPSSDAALGDDLGRSATKAAIVTTSRLDSQRGRSDARPA